MQPARNVRLGKPCASAIARRASKLRTGWRGHSQCVKHDADEFSGDGLPPEMCCLYLRLKYMRLTHGNLTRQLNTKRCKPLPWC